MTQKFNLYLGKAGQLVVMSEFLARGWNVATPEVTCSKVDFTAFVDNFEDFPLIIH
ncbi:MAG: hypothetical protein RLZZ628_2707 [Bacteroidota bacterium]|jgi:hypothetical protein